jgi:Kef-type K+ transport system membrane component KefB
MTTALAWLAVAAVCVAAALFGQTARTSPLRRGRRSSPSTRIGMALSMSGPWVAVLLGVGGGALTGQWLVAAAAALVAIVVVALVGLLLAPR